MPPTKGKKGNYQDNEAPDSLKKLVRVIVRAFYTREHCLIMDMLVRNFIMKEDDLCDRLIFERKQLRTILNTLKTDQLLKTRVVVETDADGKHNRVYYYYIDYKLFLNVVKYRLDLMRRKLESDERQSTSRASFKCPDCDATYTDLQVNCLLDIMSGKLICTYCRTEVLEEDDNASRTDARTMMTAFNNQLREPIDVMLRDCEGIHLSSSVMEPEIRFLEPRDSNEMNSQGKSTAVWSGDASRNMGFGATQNSVVVTFGSDADAANANQPKERPKWLTESTISQSFSGVSSEPTDDSVTQTLAPGRVPTALGARESTVNSSEKMGSEEIMHMLLVCERKHLNQPLAAKHSNQESSRKRKSAKNRGGHVQSPKANNGSSSDDEDNSSDDNETDHHSLPKKSNLSKTNSNKSMNNDQFSSNHNDSPHFKSYQMNLGGRLYDFSEISSDMIKLMKPEEKADYIRIGRDIYNDIYE